MTTPEGAHEGLLQKTCRVCGQYLSKPGQKVPKGYSCSNYQDTLLKVFNIDIDQDNKSTHPTNFCHGCHNIVYFHNKAINPFMVKFSQRIKKYTTALLIIFILGHLRQEVLSNYIFSKSSGVAEQDGGTLIA